MKIFWLVLILVFTNLKAISQVPGNVLPQTFDEKLSYAVVYELTNSLSKMNVKLKREWIVQGIIDALDSMGIPKMTKDEMELIFQELRKRNKENIQEQQANLSAPNIVAGQEYVTKQMAANSKMKKTSSGLVYQVIKEGKGKKPTAESVVDVKYIGTLIDGTIFDQTTDKPATFGVNQVIPGWTEGLQLMSEGSTYKLIIPADLAYGNNPPPQTPIQPGSTLVFEVTLIKIQK